jgi:helix-hairpin-helix protein
MMKTVLLMVFVATLLGIIAAAQEAGEELPAGPGRDTAIRLCVNACHPARTVVAYRHSRAEWRALISLMLYKGPKWSDEDGKIALEYFHRAFGLINVNTGTKEDLAIVLELPDAVAAEIVKHRVKRGPFHSLTDLAAVRGVKPAMLEPVKDRIRFTGP